MLDERFKRKINNKTKKTSPVAVPGLLPLAARRCSAWCQAGVQVGLGGHAQLQREINPLPSALPPPSTHTGTE